MPGTRFWKMSGSGNDFIVFDGRQGEVAFTDPGRIRALCARGTGVGADGVVVLAREPGLEFRMLYFNSDGSRAEMCGNAALCITRLAAELGAGTPSGMRFATDAGTVTARIGSGGRPEVDMSPVLNVVADTGIEPAAGERRIGYAEAGVPHLVVLCDEVQEVDVVGRGAPLRRHASLPRGANVNFLSRQADGWRIRTFERGVEGETLACGTGAVASAAILRAWGETANDIGLLTRSGELLTIRFREDSNGLQPTLSGQGRIVFVGELGEI